MKKMNMEDMIKAAKPKVEVDDRINLLNALILKELQLQEYKRSPFTWKSLLEDFFRALTLKPVQTVLSLTLLLGLSLLQILSQLNLTEAFTSFLINLIIR